jgi:hypothetical protein
MEPNLGLLSVTNSAYFEVGLWAGARVEKWADWKDCRRVEWMDRLLESPKVVLKGISMEFLLGK